MRSRRTDSHYRVTSKHDTKRLRLIVEKEEQELLEELERETDPDAEEPEQ